MPKHDFIVVGAGLAGCNVAAKLARRESGSVLLLEAAPSILLRSGVECIGAVDASVMPAMTSVNTKAPSMMNGYRAAELISEVAA